MLYYRNCVINLNKNINVDKYFNSNVLSLIQKIVVSVCCDLRKYTIHLKNLINTIDLLWKSSNLFRLHHRRNIILKLVKYKTSNSKIYVCNKKSFIYGRNKFDIVSVSIIFVVKWSYWFSIEAYKMCKVMHPVLVFLDLLQL